MSMRTVAKVGGLVGKVLEIDESTRFRHDYVRMRIACMDVTKVPRTARSTLGLFIHVFTFEREVEVEEGERFLKSGIKVGDRDGQSSPKRFRSNDHSVPGSSNNQDGKKSGKFSRIGAGGNSQSQSEKLVESAPPKMGKTQGGSTKLMGDAQRAFHVNAEKMGPEEKFRFLIALRTLTLTVRPLVTN